MKPTVQIAAARTPDGGEMVLYRHDRDFSIRVNGRELMHSRRNESERELARLGCAHLAGRKEPCVLIGGLGLGYTLREALDLLGPDGKVVVAELVEAVVDWNREFLGELNGSPLADKRAAVETIDVAALIARCADSFDAILIDIDNGPNALTDAANDRLYGRAGIRACRRALRKQGALAVWSAEPSKPFEQILNSCGFHVRRYRVPAYKGGKSNTYFIWVASEDRTILPLQNASNG